MPTPTAIVHLWEEHRRAAFPRTRAAEPVEGVDLVSLDTFTAGCVSSYIKAHGRLDGERRAVLARCVAQLRGVVPQLDEEARPYFERLRALGEAVLDATTA